MNHFKLLPIILSTLLLGLAGCSNSNMETAAIAENVSDATATAANPDQALIDRAGAPLFEGMGDHRHGVTSSDPGAQRYFDQGLTLAFAFNHAESIRSFKAAQRLDPQCAMCFWGEALATGPNINVTSKGKVIMSEAERVNAYAALQSAVALKDKASVAEQNYIEALQARYNGKIELSRDGLDEEYAMAMGELAAAYPEDMDAAALYAESVMNTMPWNYWQDNGDPRPETVKVITALERVLAAAPKHPLALHLYIHAVEASSAPQRAESAADSLATLVPGAGHLVHMPAHIYWRVGRYHDASKANIEAARVDEVYIAQCNAQGFYPALYYPHNIHFLWAASTMEGRAQLSIDSAIKVAKNVNIEQVKQFPTIEFFRTIPLLSYVRFGKWDEIMAAPEPPAEFSYSQGIRHYARGVALAARGDLAAARAEQAAIEPIKSTVSVIFLDKRDYPASLLLDIANALLLGEIKLAEQDYAGAAADFKNAVAFQDRLPYTEPPFWYYPTRQSLGYALLKDGQAAEAEAVYRQDLTDYPRNGWSLFGLSQALDAQGKTTEAATVNGKFETVWQMSDIKLTGSRL